MVPDLIHASCTSIEQLSDKSHSRECFGLWLQVATLQLIIRLSSKLSSYYILFSSFWNTFTNKLNTNSTGCVLPQYKTYRYKTSQYVTLTGWKILKLKIKIDSIKFNGSWHGILQDLQTICKTYMPLINNNNNIKLKKFAGYYWKLKIFWF